MTFLCAERKNEAVAAHGSKPKSSFLGVMLGVGGISLVSDRFELRDNDRCLDNCPADMARCSVEMGLS